MVVSLQVGVQKTEEEIKEDKKKAKAAAAVAAVEEKKKAEADAAAIKLIPRRDSAEELRAAHRGVKIDIDIGSGGLDSIPDLPGLSSAPAAASASTTPNPALRKGLGFLAAYKKSNGLI